MITQRRKKFLVWAASLAALLPYALPHIWLFLGGDWKHVFAIELLGGIVWLVLALVALSYSGWQKKLLWILTLFPVAFGPSLFVLWLWIGLKIGGFAP